MQEEVARVWKVWGVGTHFRKNVDILTDGIAEMG